MKTIQQILVCVVFLYALSSTTTTEGITFLPTEFVPQKALEYAGEGNGNTINLRADLCDASYYQNCYFEANVNTPFNEWSLQNGVYVKFSIIGGVNCDRVYCSNDLSAANPQNCSFFLDPNNGPTLYYISTAGASTDIPATFNLRIDCGVLGNSTFSNYTGGCPSFYNTTKKDVKIEQPASVETSPYNPAFFQFVACPETSPTTSFNFVLTASDARSAFSTYICESTNSSAQCGAGYAQPGWYDASGSGINVVSQEAIPAGILSAAVYGWGDYGANNSFTFNIGISELS
jgi:hypothetical protein